MTLLIHMLVITSGIMHLLATKNVTCTWGWQASIDLNGQVTSTKESSQRIETFVKEVRTIREEGLGQHDKRMAKFLERNIRVYKYRAYRRPPRSFPRNLNTTSKLDWLYVTGPKRQMTKVTIDQNSWTVSNDQSVICTKCEFIDVSAE